MRLNFIITGRDCPKSIDQLDLELGPACHHLRRLPSEVLNPDGSLPGHDLARARRRVGVAALHEPGVDVDVVDEVVDVVVVIVVTWFNGM